MSHMVQAYGFTPKQSTRMLDAFQRIDEVHEHQDLKRYNGMLSVGLLLHA